MPRRCYLFIDVQKYFFDCPPFPELVLPAKDTYGPRWEQLLRTARSHTSDTFIAHVQHAGDEGDVDAYGAPLWELQFEPLEGEMRLYKAIPSVFDVDRSPLPPLAEELRTKGVQEVVIAGCQSEHCVRAAALSSIREGFKTVLLSGAHGTTTEEHQRISDDIDRETKAAGGEIAKWDEYKW